jgi:multifunctional methyltransferase subunit TRM112
VVPAKVDEKESEFVPEFTANMLGKVDWEGLRFTAEQMKIAELPEEMPEDPVSDEGFLRSVHTLLMDVHVVEGHLECRNCGRAYPIAKGIPNMLLREDEV